MFVFPQSVVKYAWGVVSSVKWVFHPAHRVDLITEEETVLEGRLFGEKWKCLGDPLPLHGSSYLATSGTFPGFLVCETILLMSFKSDPNRKLYPWSVVMSLLPLRYSKHPFCTKLWSQVDDMEKSPMTCCLFVLFHMGQVPQKHPYLLVSDLPELGLRATVHLPWKPAEFTLRRAKL